MSLELIWWIYSECMLKTIHRGTTLKPLKWIYFSTSLNPHYIVILKSFKLQGLGGGPIGPLEKITYNGYVFAFKATKNIPMDYRDTRANGKSSFSSSMNRTWNYNCTL